MAVKNSCLSGAWYRDYCAAMLETDASKIFAGVERARKAIQARASELRCDLLVCSPENQELDRAMRFLSMLLDCSRAEKSNILLTRDRLQSSSSVPSQVSA